MGDDLLSKWLGWWQPLSGGLTPWGFVNGLLLTGGWFWSRVRGGYNLYRGADDKEQIDWSHPVGAGASDSSEVREFAWTAKPAGGRHWYGLKVVGAGGLESSAEDNLLAVAFDESGRLKGGLGGLIRCAWAVTDSAGYIKLKWLYDGLYECAEPDEFVIYHDGGSGQIDFSSARGQVPYRRGQVRYEWSDGPFAAGTKVRFYVCARNSAGESNGVYVDAVAEGFGQVPSAVVKVTLAED